MNPLQRKAKTVEMTKSTDHRDVSGGLGRRLWRLLPYAALVAVAAAVPVATGSAAGSSLPKPGGLKTFVKRLDEPRRLSADGAPQFTRTPSFAWRPVRGATRYEFELSTSKRFRADNGVIWSSKTLTTPGGSCSDLSCRGSPGPSLYWHVRATWRRGISRVERHWSLQHALDGPASRSSFPASRASSAGRRSRELRATTSGSETSAESCGTATVFRSARSSRRSRPSRTSASTRPFAHLERSCRWRVRARRQLYGSTKNGLPSCFVRAVERRLLRTGRRR